MVQTLGKSNKGFHWFYLKWLGLHSFVRWPRKARCGRGQPKSSVPSICFSWMFTWKLQGAYQTSSFSLSSEIFSNGSPRLSSSWPFESSWTRHLLAEQALDLSKVSKGEPQKGWKRKSHCHFWRETTWPWKWTWEWKWFWWWSWCWRHAFWSGCWFYWAGRRVEIALHGLQ